MQSLNLIPVFYLNKLESGPKKYIINKISQKSFVQR